MTTIAVDERGLLAAAQGGDEHAFRALVAPYGRVLEVHAYRMLGSVHDAEDVVQETLLRAWRSLERFERRASVTTWLYRIATNACLDELERRPRRPEPVVDPYPDDRLAAAALPLSDPAARYALHEGMELALLTAIQRLPGRQRAVLILRDVLGWSGPDTADTLGTTVAAVNSALQRARATLEHEPPARSVAPGRSAQRDLLRRYVDAWERADMDALLGLLHADAVLSMPPEAPVAGASAIVAFFAGRMGFAASPTWANGRPAVALRGAQGALHRLLVLDAPDGRVALIRVFTPASASAF